MYYVVWILICCKVFVIRNPSIVRHSLYLTRQIRWNPRIKTALGTALYCPYFSGGLNCHIVTYVLLYKVVYGAAYSGLNTNPADRWSFLQVVFVPGFTVLDNKGPV